MKSKYQKSHLKRNEQLGMPLGTASGKLRKAILFQLVQDTKRDTCYRCKSKISRISELSIEHMIPWLDSKNPQELFFDISNIAFSHIKCNISAARKTNQKYFTEEEKIEAQRRGWRESKKRNYSIQKRRIKRETTGY